MGRLYQTTRSTTPPPAASRTHRSHTDPARSAQHAVREVIQRPGQPLEAQTQVEMEARFGHSLNQIRVHADSDAAESAQALDALAYTVGQDVVFGAGQYAPRTPEGQQLIAHELAHTVQQRGAVVPQSAPLPLTDRGEREAETAMQDVSAGRAATVDAATLGASVQRQHGTPPVSVRLPAVEETVTQISAVAGALSGRPLGTAEHRLAEPIFGTSIDYSRVRIIETSILEYRTIGNVIRVPENFTIQNADMAQTLVHELTHVWQYQHSGTSYLSTSLQTQIGAVIQSGTRNAAYDYTPSEDRTFFEFTPEQQGLIVENTYAMLRDQNAPAEQTTFYSNHMNSDGSRIRMTRAARMSEISDELPIHQTYISQMQAATPLSMEDILRIPTEYMTTPGAQFLPEPTRPEMQIAPLRPLLRIDFNIPGV